MPSRVWGPPQLCLEMKAALRKLEKRQSRFEVLVYVALALSAPELLSHIGPLVAAVLW